MVVFTQYIDESFVGNNPFCFTHFRNTDNNDFPGSRF